MDKKRGLSIRRLVVKFGTANLCSNGQLNQDIFNDFAKQIAELQNQGIEVVVVSSGAIKAGRESMENLVGANTIHHLDKKDLAGIGARHLLNRWGNAFENYGEEVGQVWVTFGNWANEGEKNSIQSSIFDYLKSGVVPVLNENDVVSDREIKLMDKRISENDRLAKMVASLVGADAVLFLTEEGGIYEEDPKINSQARLYEEVSTQAKPELIGISSGTSGSGTGGMMAKWKEASRCAKKGMLVAIAGNEENVILKFAQGKTVGTRIGTMTKLKQD
ncbi:MAG: glutamate 5-kinase [Parcubacteria group bacterium LiPW_39]|nr:MAG: glutamate 5-kinase [Parcubacteria group bacterium LiPW_39]